jgi:hypothetical protein
VNLLTEFQYFPSVILYKKAYKVSNIVFEQYEYYQKMSFRNRCRIAGSGGTIDLSIPLEKGRDQKTLIRDVRISGSRPWQAEQWKTILSCYSRSPWLEFYRDGLEQLYRRPAVFLVDWNLACFEWSVRTLGLSLETLFTDAYRREYPGPDWEDWRGRFLPGSVHFPADGDIPTPPKYRQVFEERTGFLPGLSILDLLFCEGPNASRLLVE